ncbi:MAG: Phenylalanyl-tRNA synthetase beta chain [Candidatus Carbobacillus altaicus]|uniref:Phenylalanine--tRNA ligase beta subunit n=1 Tax=Candidatus Carbonibacillus altaicus TaxID=2163959 RepID=A0A2R6Y4J6_9BACL|nr:MAG: Phenylalanyl-tRNA synthetase beta chain [Candidatus Carbobacillus altaicus]
MRVSYNWLKMLVRVDDLAPEVLAEGLTRAGVAVDAVVKRNPGIMGVIVAEVTEVKQHPERDRLHVATVRYPETPAHDEGSPDEVHWREKTVVTGARNVYPGKRYAYATVGAVLPGGVNIGVQTFGGIRSEGMLTSAKELGLDDAHLTAEEREGLMFMDDDAPLGADIIDVLDLNDRVLELDLTPNRADCLNMIGVAYEVSAVFDRPLAIEEPPVPAFSDHAQTLSGWSVHSDDLHLCPRYEGRLIEGVRPIPSPAWLKNRLLAAGIRPINVIVDVTNEIMLRYGQPLHAFDADTFREQRVVVRRARPGETLTTLDGKKRILREDDLVITDGHAPVGLAGVMGGASSEVKDTTRRIFLEAALFDGSTIRKTAQAFDLRSEASKRFEKGLDPSRLRQALDEAAYWIAKLTGGEVVPGIAHLSEEGPYPVREEKVEILGQRLQDLLGMALTSETVADVFRRLRFPAVYNPTEDRWRITVPTRRADIRLPEDIVEEVARLVGYDAIPVTLATLPETSGGLNTPQKIRRKIVHLLSDLGLLETRTYVLGDEKKMTMLPLLTDHDRFLRVRDPLAAQHQVLRRSLFPGLLIQAEYNKHHGEHHIRLFELGKVFEPSEQLYDTLPHEPYHLAALWHGGEEKHVHGKDAPDDFYTAKGVLKALISRLGLSLVLERAVFPGLHPGRSARIIVTSPLKEEASGTGRTIGWIGEVHPAVARSFDLERPVGWEIDVDALIEVLPDERLYEPIARFPSIRRDLSLLVDASLEHQTVEERIVRSGAAYLKDVQLFDVYTGQGLPSGKKSLAYALYFQAPDKTLQDEEVEAACQTILEHLERSGIKRREGI